MSTQHESLRMIRRQFVKLSACFASGLGLPRPSVQAADPDEVPATAELLVNTAYLGKGLNALARAHHMSSMAGHLGASLIAGYYVGKQRPDLNAQVGRGIEGDLARVIAGESVFGRKMSKKSRLADAELFEPFPNQNADATLIDGIAEALAKSIDKPRQSGHNVIFASLAIRALKEHPEYAKPNVIDGIVRLLNLFKNQTPGSGYYGKNKGRIHGNKIALPDDDDTPEYDDIQGMASAIFDEAVRLTPANHRSGYGGPVHLINHAAAIADLADCGYAELALRAVRSHRQHLRLWRNLPNVADEKGPLPVSKFTPHSPAYWTSGDVPDDRALLTHRVKTMFGFDELAKAVGDESKKKAAYDKLRYLM